jgi:NitT/TauT family transport system substrate-binding protein
MKHWKKLLALALTLALALSLAGCGKTDPQDTEDQTEEQTEEVTGESYAVAALKGPTAMGLVKLMSDAEGGADLVNDYTFTLAASADEVSPLLMRGLDMACVSANLAAVLYQKTEGDIVTLAVNTLGVLYIVENGNAVTSMADLAGKTIVASGKGSTPEYALRYLLAENGLDPDADVTIDWKSEHSECVTALATGAATIAMLPQPFVTWRRTRSPACGPPWT